MNPKISFIIPHKGREEMLWQTIESISKQSIDKAQIEVIIVSQNNSLSVPESLSDINCQIELLTSNLTISALRNLGVQWAQGKYLAFLDADVYLSENWASDLIRLLEEYPSRVLVSAMQINSDQAPPLEQIRTCLSNTDIDSNVSFMPGRNLLMRTADFVKTQGFPEHLTTCEDYFFTNELSKIGNIYYSSKAHYVHLGEDKQYLPMFKKEIWRGHSNLLSIQGRTPPLRELPSFFIPIVMLVLVIMAISLFGFGYIKTAGILILLSLIPIAVYSLRLLILCKRKISIKHIFSFYLLYFPARSIGSVQGLIQWFKHKKAMPSA